MVRTATIEDKDAIKTMALKFVKVSGYDALADEETIDNLIEKLLNADPRLATIFIEDDKGFIAAMATPFFYGKGLNATEIAWWVNPEHRLTSVGKDLLDAFEFWARYVSQCSIVTMSSLDENVGKIYEARGYKLSERAYSKVL